MVERTWRRASRVCNLCRVRGQKGKSRVLSFVHVFLLSMVSMVKARFKNKAANITDGCTTYREQGRRKAVTEVSWPKACVSGYGKGSPDEAAARRKLSYLSTETSLRKTSDSATRLLGCFALFSGSCWLVHSIRHRRSIAVVRLGAINGRSIC
jgi:hypothetical protein